MEPQNKFKSLKLLASVVRLNFKIIFANKFIYFLLAAVIFFLFFTILEFLDPDATPSESTIYNILLVPGLLLIFYPTVFGIQNDLDSRMIEILFGIPNYRYKVWLVRLILIFLLVFIMLMALAFLSSLILTSIMVLPLVAQLMFPILFIGGLAFMAATVIRNGNGTAVVLVIIGMFFWIASEPLQASKWNLFLNPFQVPTNMNEMVWADITLKNRIYLTVGLILAVLIGLFKLQKREKFI